jgi:hypothetical protein
MAWRLSLWEARFAALRETHRLSPERAGGTSLGVGKVGGSALY